MYDFLMNDFFYWCPLLAMMLMLVVPFVTFFFNTTSGVASIASASLLPAPKVVKIIIRLGRIFWADMLGGIQQLRGQNFAIF